MIIHEKTVYTLSQVIKADEIKPVFNPNDTGELQRMIHYKSTQNNVLTEKLIPFKQICIIPVLKNDKRRNCIEIGFFSHVKLDKDFKVIDREGEIPSLKLYADDDLFHLMLSTFSQKI